MWDVPVEKTYSPLPLPHVTFTQIRLSGGQRAHTVWATDSKDVLQ